MAILEIVYGARDLAWVPYQIASQMSLDTDVNTSEYRAVQWAVKQYSQYNPRSLVVAITPTGAKDYDLTIPISGYKFKSYKVLDVAYPGNDSQYDYGGVYDQNKLDRHDFTTFINPLDSSKPYLRFLNGTHPGAHATNKIFLYYAAPHEISSTADTISSEESEDIETIQSLVASRIMTIAANYYARLEDATVEGISIDGQALSSNYKQRAKELWDSAKAHMEMKVSHTGRIEWDSYSSEGDERFWNDSRYL